jgi:hypothetical protein
MLGAGNNAGDFRAQCSWPRPAGYEPCAFVPLNVSRATSNKSVAVEVASEHAQHFAHARSRPSSHIPTVGSLLQLVERLATLPLKMDKIASP